MRTLGTRYLLFGAGLGLIFAGTLLGFGNLRDFAVRAEANLAFLRTQFSTDAGSQAADRERALTAIAQIEGSEYRRVQIVLSPVGTCPSPDGGTELLKIKHSTLDRSELEELARWIESFSIVPVCLERDKLENAAAWYKLSEEAMPGISGHYLKLQTQMASAYLNRAYRRYDAGSAAQAEADWSQAKEFLAGTPFESFGDLAERLAPAHRAAHQYLLSMEYARNPSNKVAGIYLAQAYNATNDGDRALREAAPLLEAMPTDTRVWQQYGQALVGLNRKVEAEAALREAVRLAPDDLQALNRLGVFYLATGDSKQAEALFRRALASEGGSEAYWVWEHLGDALLKQGDKAGAAEAYKVAVNVAPSELSGSARAKLTSDQ